MRKLLTRLKRRYGLSSEQAEILATIKFPCC